MLTEDPKPYLTKTKSGESAIGLIDESYYLEVKRTLSTWSFRIQSFSQPNRYNTSWVKVDDFYKLETSRLAKKIRDSLDKIYPGEGPQALNIVIQQIELYQNYWEPEVEEVKAKEPTTSDILVETALKEGILLFCDQHSDPHIQIPSEITLNVPENVTSVTSVTSSPSLSDSEKGNISYDISVGNNNIAKDLSPSSLLSHEIKCVYKLSSKIIKEWLAGLMWRKHNQAVKSDVINSSLNVLAALSRENPVIHLYNRVAKDAEGNWWLDLSNEKWEAIKITDEGWEIVEHPPIIFRRYSHQRPLYMPTVNGSLAEFLNYIRLADVDAQLLYLVSQISYLIPGIPHPITLLWGGKGTIKSTSQGITKKLIDNSSVGLISMPNKYKDNELIQQLDHHYIASYDNVGSIDDSQSDVFCRAVTGLGVSKRQLYTDDEDITKSFQRCVSMNGINLPADKSDILDRAITYETIPTPKSLRQPLSQIESTFKAEAGNILGAFLDVLVLSRTFYDQIELNSLNRMADFTKWGCAITEALGIDHNKFLIAYQKNINEVEIESLRSSTVGDVLVRFLELVIGRDTVTPSGEVKEAQIKSKSFAPTELYQSLKTFADANDISVARGDFPANPKELGKRINEILPNLPSVGFQAQRKRTRKEREIIFSRITPTRLDDVLVYQDELSDNAWEIEDLREHFGVFG